MTTFLASIALSPGQETACALGLAVVCLVVWVVVGGRVR